MAFLADVAVPWLVEQRTTLWFIFAALCALAAMWLVRRNASD